MSKSVKKLVEEAKEQGYTDIDLCDRGLSNIKDIPGLSKFGSVSIERCVGLVRPGQSSMKALYVFSLIYFSSVKKSGAAYVKS